MTIDEAIEERQKVIEVQEKLYEEASTNESKEIIKSATDNDRQLVEWLTELKEAKKFIRKLQNELLKGTNFYSTSFYEENKELMDKLTEGVEYLDD